MSENSNSPRDIPVYHTNPPAELRVNDGMIEMSQDGGGDVVRDWLCAG